MADVYKIETKEELLEKLNEEIEILESIYDGEGVVVEQPKETGVMEQDVNTESSGMTNSTINRVDSRLSEQSGASAQELSWFKNHWSHLASSRLQWRWFPITANRITNQQNEHREL